MKASLARLTPVFSTNRMVRQYTEEYYLPALQHWNRLRGNGFQAAKALARWKERVRGAWGGVQVVRVDAAGDGEVTVGTEFPVRCTVQLNGLDPSDVQVELYYGPVAPLGGLASAARRSMRSDGAVAEGHEFAGEVPCSRSGKHGFAVRVLPHHPNLVHPWDLGLVAWN